jgi:hypothetical protein
VHRTLGLPDDVPSRAEERTYLPAWQVDSRPDQLAALTGGRTLEQDRQICRRLAAGTDTGTGYLLPGFACTTSRRCS